MWASFCVFEWLRSVYCARTFFNIACTEYSLSHELREDSSTSPIDYIGILSEIRNHSIIKQSDEIYFLDPNLPQTPRAAALKLDMFSRPLWH